MSFSKERTLCIVKPDAVGRNLIGRVLTLIEGENLKIVAIKMVHLDAKTAGAFYAVHKDRPFFRSLVDFMTSGPCVPMVLEGENAIPRLRTVMGATDPKEAAPGTIRKELAESKERNCVHGSDAPASAATEIPFFFPNVEIHIRA